MSTDKNAVVNGTADADSNGNNQLAAFFDESEPDPLDAILNPSAPIELGDLDRSTSNLISSIDNRFGSISSSVGRRKSIEHR